MSTPGRDDTFPALCARVRKMITIRQGKTGSQDYLLLLDLIEMLGIDKADRFRDPIPPEKPE